VRLNWRQDPIGVTCYPLSLVVYGRRMVNRLLRTWCCGRASSPPGGRFGERVCGDCEQETTASRVQGSGFSEITNHKHQMTSKLQISMLQIPKRCLGVWTLTPNERKAAHLGSYQLMVIRHLALHHLPINTSTGRIWYWHLNSGIPLTNNI